MYSTNVRLAITETHRKLLLLFCGEEIHCTKERRRFFKVLATEFVSYEESLSIINKVGDFYEYANKYKEDRDKVNTVLESFTEGLWGLTNGN